MQKQPNRLWITVLVLGWVFDFLFWKHAPGVQFAIFAGLTLSAGFALLSWEGIRPVKGTLILVPFIAFFAVMTFVRLEPLTIFLTHMFTLYLMAGLAVTYAGGRWMHYSAADHVVRALQMAGSLIALPIQFGVETKRASAGAPDGIRRQIWPVIRGLLLAIPVLAVFSTLLSSADPIFAERLDAFIKLFKLENLPEYIGRAIYIAIIAYALAGVYLHAARKSGDEKLLGLDKPLIPPFFGFIEATVVLGSIVLLFAAFVVIQFEYFFGGQANITITGYTYAEYARRGFGELVAVAFFSLLLFLGLSAVVKRESSRQHNIFAGLSIALLALVVVMLVSAYQRLVLYETAYGFTRLRTYTHVFMLWLGLLLAAVIVLDLMKRQRMFPLAAVAAAVGFVISLSLLNVDGFIVRQNVRRTMTGRDLDVGYLASLSADAVPALVEMYRAPSLNLTTHQGIGAALACVHAEANSSSRRNDSDWRSFTLADWWAKQALQSVSSELGSYRIEDDEWVRKVKTPDGVEYDCWSEVFD
jgi:hypothetical protein